MTPSTSPNDLLSIAQACRRIPGARGNARVNPSTVTRWIIQGCPARSGERVRLAATRVGGRWMVTEAALAEFFGALARTAPTTGQAVVRAKQRTEAQRAKAVANALTALEKLKA